MSPASDQIAEPPGPRPRPWHARIAALGRLAVDRPSPACRHQRDGRADRDRWDCSACASRRAGDPARRRVGEEQRRQREDHDQPGHDEARAADQGASDAADPPGAEDRQLSRGGARQQAGRRDAVLELAGRQPAALLHAQLPQQRDVRGRAAEPDTADPAPLARDRAQRHPLPWGSQRGRPLRGVLTCAVLARRHSKHANLRPAGQLGGGRTTVVVRRTARPDCRGGLG